MRRGEIRVVEFDPAQGNEANKRRPAVIVSSDAACKVLDDLGRGVVTVVPLTSNVARIYPFQVLLPAGATGLRSDSKAQAEQIRSLDVARVGRIVGRVPVAQLAELDAAMRLHLQL